MKDDFYRKMLYSSTLDLVLRSLGPQWAQAHKSHVKLLSDLCYYALTTLRGMQTLGEEYCDLVQVTSASGTPPEVLRRVVLMCAAILVPFLYRTLTAKLLVMSRPRLLHHQPLMFQHRQRLGSPEEELVFSPIASVVRWFRAAKAKFDAYRFEEPTAQFLQTNIPRVKQSVKIYKRLHLGLFYLFGVYYHISKRAAGIEYVFNRKVTEPRLQYHVLGLMIFAQLGIQGLMWASEQARAHASRSLGSGGDGDEEAEAGLEGDEEAQRLTAEAEAVRTRQAEGDYEEAPICGLCLEPRKFTTASPCGHLFCWYCIHEACKAKPECPMCRRTITPAALTRLHNYK